MIVDFDPRKHKGKKIFEVQTQEIAEDDKVMYAAVVVESSVSFEEAARTPYFFVVEED